MKNKLFKSILKKGVLFALLLTIANYNEVMIDSNANIDISNEYEVSLLHNMLLFL